MSHLIWFELDLVWTQPKVLIWSEYNLNQIKLQIGVGEDYFSTTQLTQNSIDLSESKIGHPIKYALSNQVAVVLFEKKKEEELIVKPLNCHFNSSIFLFI